MDGQAKTSITFETPVVVVGGGPVGLIAAYALARLDVPCLLAEQSLETTKWPKMDLTNCRSMEILRMWRLADEYRALKGSVSKEANFDTLFYNTAAPGGEIITKWALPSVQEWRQKILEQNDGSQPAEPGQRCSQIIFEAWMKQKCLEQPSIDGRFGWIYQSAVEDDSGVTSFFIDLEGQTYTVRSKYLIGCDGGGSKVRRGAGIRMIGGYLPYAMYLVHFKSKELSKLSPFGRFWHMFPPTPDFVLDQDDEDTYTTHWSFDDLNTDVSKIDPKETVYKVLGGAGKPYRFQIDEVLVSSAWRPNFGIAEKYISSGGRILLAGDAAHRLPPHGGYGMNSGIEDAFAIAWRLVAVVKGYGGEHLLQSYEAEQRPTMIKRLERCDRHVHTHVPRFTWHRENPGLVMAQTEEGKQFRQKIADNLQEEGPETIDRGMELDARYESAVIYQDGSKEPAWEFRRYTPSTRPGARAPALFLKDGKTNIVDLFGKEFTLVTFAPCNEINVIQDVAQEMCIPLKVVELPDEDHAHKIWEANHVLIRADGHVAWRSDSTPSRDTAIDIWKVVTGQVAFPGYEEQTANETELKVLAIAKAVETLAVDEKPRFAAAFQY